MAEIWGNSTPDEWMWSSYKEYICSNNDGICKFDDILDINLCDYKMFTENGISYQRELSKIKNLIIE